MIFDKEEDLAKVVVSHYERLGFDVYKEVCSWGGGSARLDIYCVKDGYTVAIETKMSLGLPVIEQARGWQGRANKVYVAVPKKGRSKASFATEICEMMGIGILMVNNYGVELRQESAECLDPANAPKTFEEQKDSVAGNARGEFITPFSLTRGRLYEYVKNNPGCDLSDAVKSIKHHYQNDTSARGSIRKMIHVGVIKEIRSEKSGKMTRLWVNENNSGSL